jgi:transmembrane sensor
MNDMHNNSQAMDPIARYLSGEMDDAEKLQFEQRLGEDIHLNNKFQVSKESLELMEFYSVGSVNDINTDKAWQNLSSRIGDDQKESSVVQSQRIFQLPLLLKWAAAVLIIAGLGWVSYLGWVSPDEKQLLVFENMDQEMVAVKTLDDGSLVYLAQYSHITYPEIFADNERTVKITGEVFFDVAHDAQKPFKIQAQNATIEVLGTSFNVKTNLLGRLELFVESGKVKVWFDNNGPKSVSVSKGQLLTLENGLAEVVNPDFYNTQWRRNLLQFKDEKLENILHILGKTYGFEFITEDDQLNNRIMTLAIYEGSLETISELIALSLSIDYEIKNDSLVVFSNRK